MDSEQTEQRFPTDAELWLDLINGQTHALGALYDRHAALVYGIALKILENTQEAEDLTQDIFLKFIHKSAYNPERGSLRTFLAILTRSRAIDRLRSRQTTRSFLNRWQISQAATPEAATPVDYAAQQEQVQEVQAALAQLSESQRQILQMAYYDGLTQSAIAEQLDVPLGTVKARARRGLLKLRQALQDHLDRL